MEHDRMVSTRQLALTTAAAAVFVSVVSGSHSAAPVPAETGCAVSNYEPAASDANESISQIADQVRSIPLEASPTDYAQLSAKYEVAFGSNIEVSDTVLRKIPIEFLQSRGIAVDAHERTGDNLSFLLALGDYPKSVIEASGLQKVVATPVPTQEQEEKSNYEPRHTADTLYASDEYDLSLGLAAMLFDNYCSPSQQHAILADFTRYTKQAGAHYDSSYIPAYNDNQADAGKYDDFEQRYGNVFYDQESVYSPRTEFLGMLNYALDGLDIGMVGDNNADPSNALVQKHAIVRAVLDSIVPNAEALAAFNNYAGAWGTLGEPLYQEVDRIEVLETAYEAATTETAKNAVLDKNMQQHDHAFSFIPEEDYRQPIAPPLAFKRPPLPNTWQVLSHEIKS